MNFFIWTQCNAILTLLCFEQKCYFSKNTEKEIDEEKERENKTRCIVSVKFQFRKQIAHRHRHNSHIEFIKNHFQIVHHFMWILDMQVNGIT